MGKFYFPRDMARMSALSAPSVMIHRIWAETNAAYNRIRGVRIHCSFTVRDARNSMCRVSACFYKMGGIALMDTNGSFRDEDGRVSVSNSIIIQNNPTCFDDFSFFIPFYEFHLHRPQALTVYVWFIIDGRSVALSKDCTFYFSLI